MNLTPKHLQEKWASEITKQSTQVGDRIGYMDASNLASDNSYTVKEVNSGYMVLEDYKGEEDYRSFDELSSRWIFLNKTV